MKQVLPIAWHEVPRSRWPEFPGDAGTPEEDRETTARVRLARRMVRLWSRGQRYVRICEVTEEPEKKKGVSLDKIVVHIGRLDDVSKDSIDQHYQEIETAIQRCLFLMRLGGVP